MILLGGALHSNRSSVVGPLGESNLRQLHIETAFLSCTGFSSQVGMTQTDMQDAQLKRCMVASAGRVVALVDASKSISLPMCSPTAAWKQTSCRNCDGWG